MPRISAQDGVFEDWTELYLGGFEKMEVHGLGGKRVLQLLIGAFEDSNSVSGLTLTVTGGFDVGPNGNFAIPVTSVTGDMTFTDNIINIVTVSGSPTQGVVIIENPPPVVSLLLEAVTWPTPKNGSYVRIGASWS